MKVSHAFHRDFGVGYCDLYGVDSEKVDGGNMGETDYERGFNSFNQGDPIHPRRIPPGDVMELRRYEWFRGWRVAQEMWKIVMRNRGKG